MARLLEQYRNEIVPSLKETLGRDNLLSLPRLDKIVVSMGLGRAAQDKDKKILETSCKELAQITGQKPLVCKARKSVSNFKVRRGMDIGAKVTLRGQRMYEFFDRLVNVAMPRVRDFRGLNPQSFDGHGNYSLGITEQTIFPEIDPGKVESQQGMNVTITTTARNDREARELLERMGMPFRKESSDQ
jgi:large subunit ribosomal protein L5